MRVDVSLLPALAATFMLVFARIGTMVMLLPPQVSLMWVGAWISMVLEASTL